MSKKRPLYQFGSSSEWSSGRKTLLNGTYLDGKQTAKIDPFDLGEVQTGPYIEHDENNRRTIVLTTIQDKECYLLSKPIEQLEKFEAPTKLERLKCKEGEEYRGRAKLPAIPGYAPLSKEGRQQLAALSGKELTITRDCYFGDTVRKTEFRQSLTLWFDENLKDLELASKAKAFSERSKVRRNGWSTHPTPIIAALEQAGAKGSRRILIWGSYFSESWIDRSWYPTDASNKMTVAVVDPELIHATEKIALYPGDKICVGASCKSVGNEEFTRYATFTALVIEVDPTDSSKVAIEFHQTEPDLPSIRFQYERKGE